MTNDSQISDAAFAVSQAHANVQRANAELATAADQHEKIAERVAKIRVKHGFHTRPFEELQRRVQSPQLSLAWNPAA